MLLRRALVPVVAVLIAALFVVPLALVAMQGARLRPASASAPPTRSFDQAEIAQPITEIDQAIWWRTGWREIDDPAPPDFDVLTVGRVNGEILGSVRIGPNAQMPGAGPSFVVGPKRGMILYATRGGNGSELHLFDAMTEEDRLLATVPSLLYHAALAPASGYAYFATGPGSPGIWRIALDGDDAPHLLAEPPEIVGVRPDALLTAPIADLPKQVTLVVDDIEARLAVFTCTDTCFLRVFNLRTDEVVEVAGLDPGSRILTDFIDGVVVIEGGSAFDVEAERAVPPPDGAEVRFKYDVGWELPPGWRIEERAIGMGLAQFVLIDPDDNETPLDAIGQATGNG